MTQTQTQAWIPADPEVVILRELLGAFADRDAVARLIDRYLASLDQRIFDDSWARSLFTEDVRLEFPIGSRTGRAGLAEFQAAAMAKFERTLHVGSNYAIAVHGDRATLGFNLLAAHVHSDAAHAERGYAPGTHFDIGGRMEGEAERTEGGWRLSRLALQLVWTTGEPPAATA